MSTDAAPLKPSRMIIRRGEHYLRVTHREGRIDVAVTGGDNVTEDEFAQIAGFLEDHDGAEAILTSLRGRMERMRAATPQDDGQ